MISQQKIYDHALVFCRNIMCSIKGLTIQRRMYEKDFFCYHLKLN